MAYVKTTWATGDVITAAKLNNMESGIESVDPVILSAEGTVSGNKTTFEFSGKSYNDVLSLLDAGKRLVLIGTVSTTDKYVISVSGYSRLGIGGESESLLFAFSDNASLPLEYQMTDTFTIVFSSES